MGSEGGVWWRCSVHVFFGDGLVAKRFFPFLFCCVSCGQDRMVVMIFVGGVGGGRPPFFLVTDVPSGICWRC